MSDSIDASVQHQDLILQSQIGVRKETGGLEHTGECHFCGEEVEKPKLFCGGGCASEHDKFSTINGR